MSLPPSPMLAAAARTLRRLCPAVSLCALGAPMDVRAAAPRCSVASLGRPYLTVVQPGALRISAPPFVAAALPSAVSLPPLAEQPAVDTVPVVASPPPVSAPIADLPVRPPDSINAPLKSPPPLLLDPPGPPPLIRDDVPRTIAPTELLPYFVLPAVPAALPPSSAKLTVE
jgi:hypothetical protein